MKKAAIGVDLGGTKTLCVLLSEECDVLERVKFKTAPREGQAQFTKELIKAVHEIKEAARKRKMELVGSGIGCAGLVDTKELRIVNSPNLLCLEDYPIGKHLEHELKVPGLIDNDLRMGVYGEYELGAGKGANTILGVFFGTGVGGAAIINGRLHYGASNMGGQVGCLLAQPVGGPEAASSHGIVDRIASKAAIAGEALVMATKNWAPFLHHEVGTDIAKITWGLLRKAIAKGDKQVEQMLRARMRVVGIALSNVVNFLNPDRLVLGGGLMEELGKLVLKELDAGMREYLVPEVSKPLKIVEASLGGEAVAIGAGYRALEEFLFSK